MRITIETTENGPYAAPRSICFETKGDDCDLPTLIADFIQPALHAWGFAPETIANYFDTGDRTDGDA